MDKWVDRVNRSMRDRYMDKWVDRVIDQKGKVDGQMDGSGE